VGNYRAGATTKMRTQIRTPAPRVKQENGLSNTRPDPSGEIGELFALPVTLSPRLAWLDKHGITVLRDDSGWVAFASRAGSPVEAKGSTELDAEANLALKLGIALWFEEAGGRGE
jgi:hypothetical protein